MAEQEYEEEAMKAREREVFQSERREDWGALIVAAIAIIIALIVGLDTTQTFFDDTLKPL